MPITLTKKTALAAVLLGTLTLMMSPGQANAACNQPSPVYLTIPPVTFEGGGDVPTVGQPISAGWGATTTSPTFYNGTDCVVDFGFSLPALAGSKVVPGITYTEDGVTYPILTTSIPNIGIIIGIKATTAPAFMPIKHPVTQFFPVPRPSNGMGINVKVKLIVLGQLTSGVYPIAAQPLASIYGSSAPGAVGLPTSDLMLNATTVTIKARTCRMSSATVQNVGLPPVSKNQFSGLGSSPSVVRNFSLTTVCDSGVNLYATMTDANNPGNTSMTLSPGSGTTASGVGIQIVRDNGMTVMFGPDSSAVNTTNQWYIGTASMAGDDTFTIPLQARYVQTAQNMVAGSVRAKTTITFSYQ